MSYGHTHSVEGFQSNYVCIRSQPKKKKKHIVYGYICIKFPKKKTYSDRE